MSAAIDILVVDDLPHLCRPRAQDKVLVIERWVVLGFCAERRGDAHPRLRLEYLLARLGALR